MKERQEMQQKATLKRKRSTESDNQSLDISEDWRVESMSRCMLEEENMAMKAEIGALRKILAEKDDLVQSALQLRSYK